jgi:DNA-binding MarR family transcriptional regulator
MPTDDFSTTLAQAKFLNLGNALLRAARLYRDISLAALRQQPGFERMRESHASVMPHLDLGGTRQNVLAARMGISKQAVGQLLDEIEDAGFIYRTPDPADKRARLVRLTESGQQGLLVALQVMRDVEQQLRRAAVQTDVDALSGLLQTLMPGLEQLHAQLGAPPDSASAFSHTPGGDNEA